MSITQKWRCHAVAEINDLLSVHVSVRSGDPVYRADPEYSGWYRGVFRGIFPVYPLVLSMLFDPLSAALGAATGELVFSEIMLGQFGGLGELEKFITVTIGVYIAGRLVKNPKNHVMVGVAAFVGTAAQLLMGTIVDILKVQFAVTDFEAVAVCRRVCLPQKGLLS